MFTATAFNQLPMGFRYPVQQQQQPPSIYQSQYGGFNPQIPISFQQASLSRGQSLPPVGKQYVQSKAPSYASKTSRRAGQYPPAAPNKKTERQRKHESKNKKNSKRNVSSNGTADQGLYSDKEKNNLKNSEDRSRSPSALLENPSKQDESNKNDNNQEQPTQTVPNTNGNVSLIDTNAKEEQQNSEANKKRKSRSKKKKHDRPDPYERDNTHLQQPIPPFYTDLPTHFRVHQQPLYNSYNQVYEESIRRGDVFHKQVKRSTRLPPEVKQKLLPHEDDQKKTYPIVGYAQQPFSPYPSYTVRPNFYGPTTPLNARQSWQNQGVPHVADGQKIDRLRNHIHSLENELHKLQKKLTKATLNTNYNNETSTTKDENIRTHRRSKCDHIGSPRQTPVIVELNSSINENGRGESPSKKQHHRTEITTSVQQKNNQSTGVSEENKTSTNNQPFSQSPNRQQIDSNERTRTEVNHASEPEIKVSTVPKSSREETAARLAHAAAAHVQARQQIPPPPPVQQNLVPTQEQQQQQQQRARLPMNINPSQSNDTFQPQRNFPNLNNNQSNNNETSDITEKKHNRSAEKILDAFERYYIKDGKSAVPAMKVKYIPEDNNSNCQVQQNVNNNSQRRSSSRSSQNSSASSSSTSSSTSSSNWSNTDNSSSGNLDEKKCTCAM